ncbi:stromal interaction molecule 2 isoform X2 [Trichomycterus rosablanca]|uniref:stromal interaction molecule 2 isoform X2 n=1 Tax=Trichomycterus rosablanca TaxID=2290929 RepID=UPI002F35A986
MFIIEDMQQQQQTNKHSKLHREDQHITVEELWRGWKSSEVHNWTQDDVLRWLREFVELPQYEKNFKELRVNGNTLPRIASNEPSFMSIFLKIQDQQHKHKLKLKALDVVLFGPPTRPPHNWMKDLLLIVSVVMGLGGCWFAQAQNKASKEHVSKMIKDLESLQRAEQSLRDLQEQLEQAQEEKRTVDVEKQFLEKKMRDEIQGAQEEANRLHKLRQGAVSELSRLHYAEEELEQIRGALKQAEKDMQASWSVPESLQLWLQLTHEVEMQYYNIKKQNAEQQLAIAKDEAEKIKKKRSSVLGTLHVAHSSSLDDVDHKILQAKNALAEVTACLQERLHRWQHTELLCGFPIMNNAGLPNLTATLYPDPNWMLLPRSTMSSYQMSAGIDDMEDGPLPMIPQIPVTVTPIKLSPRALVRSRRSGHIVQPSMILSPDPDLLMPIRPPISRYGDEEGEGLVFSSFVKGECLETDSDSEPVGMKYPGPGFETSPRKMYRENLDLLKSSFKVSQEDLNIKSRARKISREEVGVTGDALASAAVPKKSEGFGDSKKMLRGLSTESGYSSLRLSSREKLDVTVDPYLGMRFRDDAEMSVGSQRRKMFRDRRDLSGESLSRMMPIDECEVNDQSGNTEQETVPAPEANVETDAGLSMVQKKDTDLAMETHKGSPLKDMIMDSASARLLRDDINISMDVQTAKIFRDKQESLKERPSGMMLRDGLGMSIERGKMFRGVSIENTSRMKTRDDLDISMEMCLKDKKDEAISRKISKDERDIVTERRRLFRDYRQDSSLDNSADKKEVLDMSVETVRQKISKDEFAVPDQARFSQPDLTISSLVLWTPNPDPLSHLVYDGILEKSYQSPLNMTGPADISHPATLPSMTTSTQSLMSGKAGSSSSLSSNLSLPESVSKEKSKKTSKLKNLFKKRKDKDKDKDSSKDHPQGGLQKL